MTFKIADRVKDTTTTTGTGTVTLSGTAPSGFQSFNSGIGDGSSTCYCIKDANGTGWEVGIGTYTNSGTTLSRTTILASSNAGAAINLSSGTHTVFVTEPAAAGITGLFGGQMVLPTPTSANTGLSTWLNQGAAATLDDTDGIQLSLASDGVNDNLRLRTSGGAGLPSTPYSYTGLFALTVPDSGSICGLLFGYYDGTNKVQCIRLISQGGLPQLYVSHYSTPTTFVANDAGAVSFGSPIVWLKIRDDGTNVTFSYGATGTCPATLYTVAKSSGYLGASGYSSICFGVACNSGAPNKTTYAKLLSWQQGT